MKSRTELKAVFDKACCAQAKWSRIAVSERTRILGRVRGMIVQHRRELASAIPCETRQGFRETITSELLPLADTAQWLHQNARSILAPRHTRSRITPKWLGRIQSTVYRAPHGLVLIIGTWNYPLFLIGAQVLHALAAGNAVVLKPASGCERVSEMLLDLLIKAGVPSDLLVCLDTSVDAAKLAISVGVDHVVMTGSSSSGRSLLHQLAESLTPAVLELSGCDAVYVLPGADLNRVSDLLVFGMLLNGGATCMAPRRIFVFSNAMEEFQTALQRKLNSERVRNWTSKVAPQTSEILDDGIREAIAQGARLLTAQNTLPGKEPRGGDDPVLVPCGAIVLTNMQPSMRLCAADLFAPLLMIMAVDDLSDAIVKDSMCPYALTATVFGPTEEAERLSQHVTAGVISINDLIVPTVDPQLPFGGRGESGYGVTRGNEGLLSMTVPKVVAVRKGKWLPHADEPNELDELLLDGLLQFTHDARFRGRMRGMIQAFKAIMLRRKRTPEYGSRKK